MLLTIQLQNTQERNLPMTENQTTNYTTDRLPYKLTNDYLFRAVFQSRPKALEGLCRAVLHLSEEDTISVTLQNPIELGEKIDEKEYILDLAVLINNSRFLNLEMQVYHDPNWTDRSISYTSRSFNNLNRGEAFDRVLPVTHIGFLNYTLFPGQPEFYAMYQLMNLKNFYIYRQIQHWCDRLNSDRACNRGRLLLRCRPLGARIYRNYLGGN